VTAAADRASPAEGFRGPAVLALVLVALVAFSGFAVLGAYAPSLRAQVDPGAHALSGSAVGFRGAVILLQGVGGQVEVNRGRFDPRRLRSTLLVQTPAAGTGADKLDDHPDAPRTLIVLPKWKAQAHPMRPGVVLNAGLIAGDWPSSMLQPYSPHTTLAHGRGVSRGRLQGAQRPFTADVVLPTGPIDRLQTASGPGWEPVLVDEAGRGVLLHSTARPSVYLLAEPDLLNNQGLASLDNARAGVAILQALQGEGGVLFDVTLNGLKLQPSLARLVLEPPWLAATLCVLAAAVLMGLHALARFGAPMRRERAIALGAAALVDNSAGLIRLARKEPALAPDYLQGLIAEIARDTGASPASDPDWLERLARRRGLRAPSELADRAARVRTPEQLMAFAAEAHEWRGEMTRDSR
jgi:hypothetical protein